MASRVDEHGRAYKKSQLQVQIWANRRQRALTVAALDALPSLKALDAQLEWVSPLEEQRFAEFYDARFVRAIARPELVDALGRFWPHGGPHWDGLAIARTAAGSNLGPVLIEGKSYPKEMRSRLAAKPASRRRILTRLQETRAWLDISEQHAKAWSERYYQAANRLAHIYWFHDVLGERAWMLNLYFVDDPDHPTRPEQWQRGLATAEKELGVDGIHLPGHGRAFLQAESAPSSWRRQQPRTSTDVVWLRRWIVRGR